MEKIINDKSLQTEILYYLDIKNITHDSLYPKDITDEYIKDIHNLENINKKNYGKKYPTWKRNNGFTTKNFGDFVQ